MKTWKSGARRRRRVGMSLAATGRRAGIAWRFPACVTARPGAPSAETGNEKILRKNVLKGIDKNRFG